MKKKKSNRKINRLKLKIFFVGATHFNKFKPQTTINILIFSAS
jgi:hypothetical protein